MKWFSNFLFPRARNRILRKSYRTWKRRSRWKMRRAKRFKIKWRGVYQLLYSRLGYFDRFREICSRRKLGKQSQKKGRYKSPCSLSYFPDSASLTCLDKTQWRISRTFFLFLFEDENAFNLSIAKGNRNWLELLPASSSLTDQRVLALSNQVCTHQSPLYARITISRGCDSLKNQRK